MFDTLGGLEKLKNAINEFIGIIKGTSNVEEVKKERK